MNSLAWAAAIPAAVIVLIVAWRTWKRLKRKPAPATGPPLQETCFLLPAEESDFVVIVEGLEADGWAARTLKASQKRSLWEAS